MCNFFSAGAPRGGGGKSPNCRHRCYRRLKFQYDTYDKIRYDIAWLSRNSVSTLVSLCGKSFHASIYCSSGSCLHQTGSIICAVSVKVTCERWKRHFQEITNIFGDCSALRVDMCIIKNNFDIVSNVH